MDLEAVPITATKEEVATVFSETQYSRLPVYDGSIDNIVGILHQKDFYIGTGISPKPLNALMKEPIFVPPPSRSATCSKCSRSTSPTSPWSAMSMAAHWALSPWRISLRSWWVRSGTNTMRSWKTSSPPVSTAARCWAPPIWTNWPSALIWRSPPSALRQRLGHGGAGRIPDEGDSFDYENLHVTVTATDGHRVVAVEIKAEPKPEEQSDKAHAKEN